MTGRPAAHRWEALDEYSDPVPGDPEQVATLGRELRDMADTIDRQADEIKALSSVENWKGKGADKFRENAKGAGDKLRKAFTRYDEASKALGTKVYDDEDLCSTEYASSLYRAQKMASKALTKAEGAEDSGDAENGDLKAAKEMLQNAKEARDSAARTAAEAIKDVITNDGLEDGFWDKVGDIASKVSEIMGPIASALGVAALLLSWVPVLGQALAVLATIATAISLIANLTKALLGQGSWTDVALDAIGIATVGIGRAAAVGAKAGIKGTKALAHSKIFNSAAKSLQGKTRKPAVEALKLARKHAPGAELGSGRKAIAAGIPKKAFPSWKQSLGGLSPRGMVGDIADAAKNGPKFSARSMGDPDVNKAVVGLKDLGKVGLNDSAIRAGMGKTAGHVGAWGGSTALNFAAGPGNTMGWWNGLKDA